MFRVLSRSSKPHFRSSAGFLCRFQFPAAPPKDAGQGHVSWPVFFRHQHLITPNASTTTPAPSSTTTTYATGSASATRSPCPRPRRHSQHRPRHARRKPQPRTALRRHDPPLANGQFSPAAETAATETRWRDRCAARPGARGSWSDTGSTAAVFSSSRSLEALTGMRRRSTSSPRLLCG
jgi:hypothetical protein